MKETDFDITDSIKVISENANNAEFLTRIVHDIYELGYRSGFKDCEEIAERVIVKMSQL